jgi:hypothetical protein
MLSDESKTTKGKLGLIALSNGSLELEDKKLPAWIF